MHHRLDGAVARRALALVGLVAGTSALAACSSSASPRATDAPVTAPPVVPASPSAAPTSSATVSTSSPAEPPSPSPSTVAPNSTIAPTTTIPPLRYVFPIAGDDGSFAGEGEHHDYPAADVFACGAFVVAPTNGVISAVRTVDLYDKAVDNPAYRGGRYVAMIGDDGVRYYMAHLASVADIRPGQRVGAGDGLGVVGESGRVSACHLHIGVSRPCLQTEWQIRRGEIWPQQYLESWRDGGQLSPLDEVRAMTDTDPGGCERAASAPFAAQA